MSTGIEIETGLKQASTWGTPVACGANDGIKITSLDLNRSFESLVDESLGGSSGFSENEDQGNQAVDGSITGPMRYNGFDVLLAMFMGSATTPTLADGASSSYEYSQMPEASLEGIFFTLATDKGESSIHEFPAVKANTLELSGTAGGVVTFSLGCIGDTININTTSGTNNNTTMASLTYPEEENRILFRQATFWMNDSSGSALSSSDVIYPSSFSISFDRAQSADYQANSDNEDKTSEPSGDGIPTVSVNLGWPQYKTAHDSFISKLEAGTAQKLQIKFVGQEIESGHNHEFTILLPKLVIRNADPAISGPGKIPAEIEMGAHGVASAVSGMTGVTEPICFNIKNKRSTSPLA